MFKKKTFANTQTTVLNASLMWFGLGLALTLGVASIFGVIPQMQTIAIDVFNSYPLMMLMIITSIGLMIAISFFAFRINIPTLIGMYLLFAFVEGFTLSAILIRFAFENQTWKILLLFTIPAITMGVMGIIGYKQIIDFSKWGKFLMFSLIGLMLMGLIMYFVPGIEGLWVLYSMIGYAIFTLYVGFDMWRISRLDQVMRLSGNDHKETILRYGIMFGLSLLIDFVQLVWFLARMIR